MKREMCRRLSGRCRRGATVCARPSARLRKIRNNRPFVGEGDRKIVGTDVLDGPKRVNLHGHNDCAVFLHQDRRGRRSLQQNLSLSAHTYHLRCFYKSCRFRTTNGRPYDNVTLILPRQPQISRSSCRYAGGRTPPLHQSYHSPSDLSLF